MQGSGQEIRNIGRFACFRCHSGALTDPVSGHSPENPDFTTITEPVSACLGWILSLPYMRIGGIVPQTTRAHRAKLRGCQRTPRASPLPVPGKRKSPGTSINDCHCAKPQEDCKAPSQAIPKRFKRQACAFLQQFFNCFRSGKAKFRRIEQTTFSTV